MCSSDLYQVLKAENGQVELGDAGKTRISKVYAGNNFTLLLCEDGNVYAAGTQKGFQNTFAPVSGLNGTVKLASAYGDHFAMVLNSGYVAYGSSATNLNTFVLPNMNLGVSEIQKIVVASDGTYLLLTTQGALLQGKNGTLEQIDGLTNVRDIDAGSSFAAVDGNGRIHEWATTSTTPVAKEMDENLHFASVYVGNDYTVAVTASGFAYSWGAASKGQLGIGTDDRNIDHDVSTGFTTITEPTPVLKGETFNADANPYLQSVLTMSAGPDRAVMVRADGFVYAWGNNATMATNNNRGVMGAHSISAGKIASEPVQVGDTEAKTLVIYRADVIDGITGAVKRTYTLDTSNLSDTVLLAPMNITMEQGDTLRVHYTTARNDLLET